MSRPYSRTPVVMAVGAVAALLIGAFGGFLRSQIVNEGEVVPFTATVLVKRHNAAGVAGETETIIEAARSDGSFATHSEGFREAPGGEVLAYEKRHIEDLTLKREAMVSPDVKSMYSWSLKDSTVERLRNRPSGAGECAVLMGNRGLTEDGTQVVGTVLGFDVSKFSKTKEGPRKTMVLETWIAPALNCYELRRVTTWFDTGSGEKLAYNTRDVVSLRPGDPDASLFAIASDVIERLPSEIVELQQGGDCPQCSSAPSIIKADGRVLAHQSKGR